MVGVAMRRNLKMTKTVLEVLEGALEILRDPKRWTKGAFAKDKYGFALNFFDRAVCFCSIGALIKASDRNCAWYYPPGLDVLSDAVNIPVSAWNDAPERTHAEIIQGFEKAIAMERAK
jgi:hypothetical protein